MKTFLCFSLILYSFIVPAQTIVSTINSGAISNSNYSHSIGEIYVINNNSDENNSGILGVIFQIQLLTLSTDEILISNNINIYPNPTKNKLFIDFNERNLPKYLYIYNSLGQKILEQTINGKSKTTDLTLLPVGIYFIRFNQNESKSYKIIKQ